MRAVSTWILVADGQRARFFAHRGVGKGLKELRKEHRERPTPPNREINADRPGRAFESVGAKRHAMESRSDPHREGKLDFAREIAGRLGEAARDGRFERLVVVAAPQTLGDLRQHMNGAVTARIMAELPKDLTKAPVDHIAEQLGSVMAV